LRLALVQSFLLSKQRVRRKVETRRFVAILLGNQLLELLAFFIP
jgi:hypothetical protein